MNADRLLDHYERIADAPDAIVRLRRFILDLAVRGKLAEQDPNDEPASELLRQIAKEKGRLVKSGEVKKPKVLPDMLDDEPPFLLPPKWQWSQIAEIGIINPRNDAPEDLTASFVPMRMIPAEYGLENLHHLRPWAEIRKGYTHFAEGDVGLAKITPCFENGKSTVFRELTGGLGSGTTELHIVRPLFVNPDYIIVFLKCPHFIETGIPRMTGTAGQKRVPIEYFANSPFPLPPLAEQHRIVAKVDELMALCDRLEKARAEREATRDRMATASLIRLNDPDPNPVVFRNHAAFAVEHLAPLTTRRDQIKVLRQTILNLAVRGKLVPQDPNDEPASELVKQIAAEKARLFKAGLIKRPKQLEAVERDEIEFCIPSSWCWTRLGKVTSYIQRGKSPKYASADGPPVVSQKCVQWHGLSLDKARKITYQSLVTYEDIRFLREGDLLWNSTGTGTIGRVIRLIDPPERLVCDSHVTVVRCLFVSSEYIRTWLRTGNVYGLIEERAAGSTNQVELTAQMALNQVVPLPPLTEQHRIAAKVDELMGLCGRLEKNLAGGDDTRRRLLDALLHEVLPAGQSTLHTGVAN